MGEAVAKPQSASGHILRRCDRLSSGRDSLQLWMERVQVPRHYWTDVILAFGEALDNGIEHGGGVFIGWRCSLRDVIYAGAPCKQLSIELNYHSVPFCTDIPPQNPFSEGGRGLFLMHAMMDDISFLFRDGMVRVRMVKRYSVT